LLRKPNFPDEREEAKLLERKTSSYILRFGFLRVRPYLRAISFREGLVFEKGEFALREAAGEERDAFADQDWTMPI